MKTCSRCKAVRELCLFSKFARASDGLNSECKLCQQERNKAHYQANKERERLRAQSWRDANPEKVKAATLAWRADNPERHVAMKAAYRANNSEKVSAARRSAYQANKATENAASREYKRAHKEALAKKQAAYVKANPEGNRMRRSIRRAREQMALPIWADFHCEANLQVIPGALNQSKRNFYWPDMPG